MLELYEDYLRFFRMIESLTSAKEFSNFSKYCHPKKRASKLFSESSKLNEGSNRKLVVDADKCVELCKYMEKKCQKTLLT